MKASQKAIGRWLSSIVAKSTSQSFQQQPHAAVRELSGEQLRQVSGGTGGGSAQGPKSTW